MNEQTVKLIKELAEKLGVTVEYLWAALLRQAPIDSAVGLLFILFNVFAAFVLYRLHCKFTAGGVYDDSEGAVFLMVIGGTLVFIFLIVSFFCLPMIIAGFINPEYWALKQILR